MELGGHGSYREDGAETNSLDPDTLPESASPVTARVSYDLSQGLLVGANNRALAQGNGHEGVVLPSFQLMYSVADK